MKRDIKPQINTSVSNRFQLLLASFQTRNIATPFKLQNLQKTSDKLNTTCIFLLTIYLFYVFALVVAVFFGFFVTLAILRCLYIQSKYEDTLTKYDGFAASHFSLMLLDNSSLIK